MSARQRGRDAHNAPYGIVPLDVGGYVADTPGIRGLPLLFDVEPTELDGYFREIAPLVPDCQFNDCTHEHEAGVCGDCCCAERPYSPRPVPEHRSRAEHEKLDDALY
ncbi:MAG: hypothetical protein R3E31_16330 [Chloroflexota bacterium]